MTAGRSLGPQSVLAHAEEVHAVEVADEMVLLHEPTGKLHLLNPTGALVWQLLDGQSSIAEIARDIAEAMSTPYDTVVTDIVDLGTELIEGGLLTAGRDQPADG